MNATAATFLAVGAIAAFSSATAKRAVGIAVDPYITDAHRKAMPVLARPLLDVGTASGSALWQALHRYNDISTKMVGLRGFRVVGRKSITAWTKADATTIIARFLEAVRAGVEAGGTYRVTNLGALNIPGWSVATDANAAALAKLFEGERPSSVPLTDLGEAVLAAVKLRRDISYLPESVALAESTLAEFNRVVGGLAIEMDACGYLESGKPPPEPTIGGGIAAAAHAVGGFMAGVAGDVAGGVVTAVVGSPWFWVAGLGLVAWKVL